MMDWINEYDVQPGVYQHYKGELYIVQGVVTHTMNDKEKWRKLRVPYVMYRRLEVQYRFVPVWEWVNGERTQVLHPEGHKRAGKVKTIKKPRIQTFIQPLTRFMGTIELSKTKTVKRFVQQ